MIELKHKNVITATISRMNEGGVLTFIEVETKVGNLVVLATSQYLKFHSFNVGDNVGITVNSIDVVIMKPVPSNIGAANIIFGKVRAVYSSEFAVAVVLDTDVGDIVSLMTNDEWKTAGVQEGGEACAVFKAAACLIAPAAEDPQQEALEFSK